MEYYLSEIASLLDTKIIGSGEEIKIEFVCFDTRRVIFPSKSVFIALVGQRRNGHDYIKSAYQKGIRNFIVSESYHSTSLPDARFIIVYNVRMALQQWAKYHRKKFSIPVVGITGSNGKTIVKEWLTEILSQKFRTLRSPKSFNSQLGVPLSVLLLKEFYEAAIFEAGISQMDEMQHLAPIIDCSIGVITNIGDAHDAGFSNGDEKLLEKLKLFKKAKKIIYCLDHKPIHLAIKAELPEAEPINWTLNNDPLAFYKIQLKESPSASQLIFNVKEEVNTLEFPFSDPSSIENIIHCIVVAHQMGMNFIDIQTRFQSIRRIDMRLELAYGSFQNLIINDGYTFDLYSLKSALNFMEEQSDNKEKVLFISDIKDHNSPSIYDQIAAVVKQHKLKQIYYVGSEIAFIHKNLGEHIPKRIFPDVDSAIRYLFQHPFQNTSILLKGARTFNFEKIANVLVNQKHQTTLEISLNAIEHNFTQYAKRIEKNTMIMAVVKAAAYGSGSLRLVRKLETLPVDYLAVAYLDEGISLRNAGVSLPILILNPGKDELEALVKYKLEPELYDMNQLNRYLEGMDKYFRQEVLNLHLKLDTGMHRSGFDSMQLKKIYPLLKHKNIHIKTIFSHLVESENPKSDPYTIDQIFIFEKMYSELSKFLRYNPIRHILNTAGIIRFPAYQYEMVRLGIGMYGVDPTNTISDHLRKAHKLTSWLSQIRPVSKGESIGYGTKAIVSSSTNVGTVGVGYADGVLRTLGNGRTSFYFNGKFCNTLGNICMDLCMIDVGIKGGENCEKKVEIFGEFTSIEDLAKRAGTIPYEILCRISSRVKRIYTED